MKKVAYIGINQYASYRRAEAYIKNNPSFRHTFVIFYESESESSSPVYQIPYTDVVYITFAEFVHTEYDLVLHMNDKLFKYVLGYQAQDVIDMSDKVLLAEAINKFGKIDNIIIDGFDDDDDVVLKPRMSSGAYSTEPLSYKRVKFRDVKEFRNNRNFIIQEFIDSVDIFGSAYVCNGTDIFFCDATEGEFIPDQNGKFYGAWVENQAELTSFRKEIINKVNEFIRYIGYNKLVGYFYIQCIIKDDKYYVLDFNTRLSPALVEGDLNNIFKPYANRLLPFMMGISSGEDCINGLYPYAKFQYFSEIDGKPLSSKPLNKSRSCMKIVDNTKTSGAFRQGIDAYLSQIEYNIPKD